MEQNGQMEDPKGSHVTSLSSLLQLHFHYKTIKFYNKLFWFCDDFREFVARMKKKV